MSGSTAMARSGACMLRPRVTPTISPARRSLPGTRTTPVTPDPGATVPGSRALVLSNARRAEKTSPPAARVSITEGIASVISSARSSRSTPPRASATAASAWWAAGVIGSSSPGRTTISATPSSRPAVVPSAASRCSPVALSGSAPSLITTSSARGPNELASRRSRSPAARRAP